MVIDSSQSTVTTFEQIRKIATAEYRFHFDSTFEPLPGVDQHSERQKEKDVATAMNNRAALMPIVINDYTLEKGNSVLADNQVIQARTVMLENARLIDKRNPYLAINQIVDWWRRGILMD